MIIKTNCLQCGKKNAVKNQVTFVPGDALIETLKGCQKCGWTPSGEAPKKMTR
jgi:hypothetical protein